MALGAGNINQRVGATMTVSMGGMRLAAGLVWVLGGCVALFASSASAQVVISQIYGGGGNSGATYKQKYVELFNAGSASVTLTGKSIQYASSAGTNWSGKVNLSGSIAANGYFLVVVGSGLNGTDIPVTADRLDVSGGE
jgi:predicted extracellular nuclease